MPHPMPVSLRRPRLLLAFVTLVLLAATASGQRNYPLGKPQVVSAEGKPAPDFTLPDQDGKPFQLSSLRGQRVLLIFYRAHW